MMLTKVMLKCFLPIIKKTTKLITVPVPSAIANTRYVSSCKILFSKRKPTCNPSGVVNSRRKEDADDLGHDKCRIISGLNFKTAQDAEPFYKLPASSLIHIYRKTRIDEKNGHCKNRLYYIANKIQVPPSVLSECIAKRTFIYSLSFDWLKNSLNVLIEMGVSGDRIVRDLWVLKYNHVTIKERLQRIKDLGVDTLYPWMVRCSEDILKRYILISKETKDILGDTKTTKVYLADRLNTSLDAVEQMCTKLPALKSIRVTKIKSFLDFLEMEGFAVEDIANTPRVLTASQKTVQKRLETLRKLGVTEINLNVLYRSRKHFKKYLESLETSKSN